MKKTVKFIAILAIMACMLVILTACGEDKLVATKIMTEEDDGLKGEARIEITFENDVANNVEMFMEFEDEEKANEFYQMYEMLKTMSEEYAEEGAEEFDFELKQDGKKLTIISNNLEMFEEEELKTKEEVKTYFEEEGFTVK